jgi:hypothetical protein
MIAAIPLLALLLLVAILSLVSYLVPVGVTLSEDDQGHYIGLRWENGWFGVIYTDAFETPSYYFSQNHIQWWLIEVFDNSGPWTAVSRRVHNRTGIQYSTTSVGMLDYPYQKEFR